MQRGEMRRIQQCHFPTAFLWLSDAMAEQPAASDALDRPEPDSKRATMEDVDENPEGSEQDEQDEEGEPHEEEPEVTSYSLSSLSLSLSLSALFSLVVSFSFFVSLGKSLSLSLSPSLSRYALLLLLGFILSPLVASFSFSLSLTFFLSLFLSCSPSLLLSFYFFSCHFSPLLFFLLLLVPSRLSFLSFCSLPFGCLSSRHLLAFSSLFLFLRRCRSLLPFILLLRTSLVLSSLMLLLSSPL